MSRNYDLDRFVSAYNDTETFPTLMDVAVHLGISYQTVRNQSCLLRARQRAGEQVPKLISRVVQPRKGDNDNAPSARDHANIRAEKLRDEVTDLLTRSRYPVVNPESVVISSYVSQTYDRVTGRHTEKEGTPRTWLSDTLRVESVQDPRGRKFIFTGAQNDADIHEAFWINLQAYAAAIDADIVVGPWTYETQWWAETNPTSRTYHTALDEYLCFGQMLIGDNFVFAGEMNTLPTASRPIGDLTTYSRGRWAVFPHAKLQLKSVPTTDPAIQAHQVMTSGAVTRPKIIPRKAGVKSIFHHVIGATLVEFDDEGDVFCRQLNTDEDGSFYDLDKFITGGQIYDHSGIDALIAGDIHLRKLDGRNSLAVLGIDPRTGAKLRTSMVDVLRPKQILLHDIFDNETRNHHHEKDTGHYFEMSHRGRDSVLDEVKDVACFLEDLRGSAAKIVVVDSNHDLALERYVREGRYRLDGPNVKIGLELEIAYIEWRERVADALDACVSPPTFSLLEHAVREQRPGLTHVQWVHDGRSYLVGEVECGNHGFRGANGARGTVAGYARLGRKMTIADKHTPEILDGVYVAGCMALQHGYNKGPSGWAIASVIQYPNGKRCLITLQGGKWRAS
jgi:hypothetical protein